MKMMKSRKYSMMRNMTRDLMLFFHYRQLLDSTKEARRRLRTGDLGELAKDFEEFEENLAVTAGIGKRSRGVKRRAARRGGDAHIPLEAKNMLGQANSLYISRDYGNAIDKLQEVITKWPNVHQAWNTLGLVHEEMGNTSKSLQLRMVAAHMNQKDADLWKELGIKSMQVFQVNIHFQHGLIVFLVKQMLPSKPFIVLQKH